MKEVAMSIWRNTILTFILITILYGAIRLNRLVDHKVTVENRMLQIQEENLQETKDFHKYQKSLMGELSADSL